MLNRNEYLATNEKRAEWADKAVEAFAKATRMEEEDDFIVLTDLLCDLMHWCDQRGISWDKAVGAGRSHYEFEHDGEEAEE